MGTILTDIHQAGFTLARTKMVHLNELQAGQFYTKLRGEPFYPDIGVITFFILTVKISSSPNPECHLIPSTLQQHTCCVIKPYAIPLAGDIIQAIKERGFQVFALEKIHLDLKQRSSSRFTKVS